MSSVVGLGFVRAGDELRVNVHPVVASAHESVTLGATNAAEKAVGVDMTWVAVLTVVLRNDPPDVNAERLNM